MFSINDPRITGYTRKKRQGKKAFNPYLKPYIKIYLKWITYLNVNYKALKLLGEKLFSSGLGKDFLEHTKREQENLKIDKLHFIKLKTSLQKARLNEKTTHRLRDNIYKHILIKVLYPEYTKDFQNSIRK